MNKITTISLALSLLLGAVAGGHAEDRAKQIARQIAGEWRLSTPGDPPVPAGRLSLHPQHGRLSGTFTPPGRPSVPLQGVSVSDKRLWFRFTLTGKGKKVRTFRGVFTPTLDAEAWTGRLSGPNGNLVVDMVRQR